MKKISRAKHKAGNEAGFCGFGIQCQLAALGIGYVLINAADIPKEHKDRRQKSQAGCPCISQQLSTKKDLKSEYVPRTVSKYS